MKRLFILFFTIIALNAAVAQDCSDLFISEYVEGWSNNKALELYNPTATAIDLSNYRLARYSNGADVPPAQDNWIVQLSGSIAPYSTFVIVLDKQDPEGSGQEAPVWDDLQSRADIFLCPVYNDSKAMYFNGDDGVALEKTDGTFVDVFAKIGPPRPQNSDGVAGESGSLVGGWTDVAPYNEGGATLWTVDHTLVRKASIKEGVKDNPFEFNPSVAWDSLPANSFNKLNWHKCDCNNANNVKPAFGAADYSFSTNVSDQPETEIGTVTATDSDGDNLSYFISEGNSYGPFKIDRASGVISVNKTEELKFPTYNLEISVTDGTEPVTVAAVITVVGANNYPDFGQETFSYNIELSSVNGTIVGTPEATDKDGDNISYEITEGNDDNIFAINSATGLISLSKTDQLEEMAYALKVTAIDSKEASHYAWVYILVGNAISAINNIADDKMVTIFPNPVDNGKFSIATENGLSAIELTNLLGQSVLTQTYSKNETNVDISVNNIEKGVYFVKIYFEDNKSVTKKIILK